MDLQINADQTLFAETARKFLESHCPLTEVRSLYEKGVSFTREYWRKAADLGWTSVLIPESFGGGSISDSGLLDAVLVAEEMGRLVSPGPLLPVNVVATAIARGGAPDGQAEVLAGLASGGLIATWAFAETDASWDPAQVRVEAVRSGDGWVLEGTKSFVQDAADADWFLVTARAGDGLVQLLVPRSAPGLDVTPQVSLDMVRGFGAVRFSGVRLPASAAVGSPDNAASEVEHQLNVALVLQNAETVGATDRVFEFTLEYCRDRVSFGRPIGSYQAIKHRLADMKLWLEACHGTATASARAVAYGSHDAAELVSVAKSYIADRCPSIIQDCVQLHGGIGVTWDADLHLYLRRVAQNAAVYGSVRQHHRRLASSLGI
jgi:alkylation response protein AidB-like acyl-CoA dehydrogenase